MRSLVAACDADGTESCLVGNFMKPTLTQSLPALDCLDDYEPPALIATADDCPQFASGQLNEHVCD